MGKKRQAYKNNNFFSISLPTSHWSSNCFPIFGLIAIWTKGERKKEHDETLSGQP
jgi:hypothetical protein